MFVSRRDFLKAGALVALAGGIPLHAAAIVNGQQTGAPQSRPTSGGNQLPAEIYSDPLFYYHKSDFAASLNTKFRILTRGFRGIVLTLAEVKDVGPVPDQQSPDKECFSLLFRSANALRQNTYKLTHDTLGTFDLFLVPLPKDRLGRRFVATINRLNP
jgi:hypothetical protein